MKKILTLIPLLSMGVVAACTNDRDVAIQTAFAAARAQECNAVAQIAASGAASEAAVLMAARGCGTASAPKTSAENAATMLAAAAPILGSAINGVTSLEAAKVAAGTQRASIEAETIRAGYDARVLRELGSDQVVTVRPEVVEAPAPVVVRPDVVELPAPVVMPAPAPVVCAPDADGILICQ